MARQQEHPGAWTFVSFPPSNTLQEYPLTTFNPQLPLPQADLLSLLSVYNVGYERKSIDYQNTFNTSTNLILEDFVR